MLTLPRCRWMNGKIDDVRLPFSTVDPIMGDLFSIYWEPEMLQSMGQTISILATEVRVGSFVLHARHMLTVLGPDPNPSASPRLDHLDLPDGCHPASSGVDEAGLPPRQPLVSIPRPGCRRGPDPGGHARPPQPGSASRDISRLLPRRAGHLLLSQGARAARRRGASSERIHVRLSGGRQERRVRAGGVDGVGPLRERLRHQRLDPRVPVPGDQRRHR